MSIEDDKEMYILSIETEFDAKTILAFKFKSAADDAAEILNEFFEEEVNQFEQGDDNYMATINEKLEELDFPQVDTLLDAYSRSRPHPIAVVRTIPLRD